MYGQKPDDEDSKLAEALLEISRNFKYNWPVLKTDPALKTQLDDYYIIDNDNPSKLQLNNYYPIKNFQIKDYPALKADIKSFAGLPDISQDVKLPTSFPTNPCVEVPVQKEEDRPVIFAAKSTRSLDI